MKGFPRQQRLVVLAIIGIVFSVVLLYSHTKVTGGFQSTPSFCSITSVIDCDAVAKSKYSTFLGVPVASYGLLYFIVFFLFVGLARPQLGLTTSAFINVTVALSFIALVPTLIELFIAYFVLNKVCIYCTFLYVVNIAIACLAATIRERELPLRQAFIEGVKAILAYVRLVFTSQPPSEQVNVLVKLSFSTILASAFFILTLPSFLTYQVFIPQAQKELMNKASQQIIELFKQGSPVTFDINLDPESGYERDFSYGAEDAAITVVEFSDFQCPYCRKFGKQVKAAVEQFRDKVQLVFKHYPLDHHCNPAVKTKYHLFSCEAAKAASCAGQQETEFFWEMHDLLFEAEVINEEVMHELPKMLGLSLQQYEACMTSKEILAKLQKDLRAGDKAGVKGTPSFYVNGRPWPFKISPTTKTFVRLFEHLLKEKDSQAN